MTCQKRKLHRTLQKTKTGWKLGDGSGRRTQRLWKEQEPIQERRKAGTAASAASICAVAIWVPRERHVKVLSALRLRYFEEDRNLGVEGYCGEEVGKALLAGRHVRGRVERDPASEKGPSPQLQALTFACAGQEQRGIE
jgi:hypothetical protein